MPPSEETIPPTPPSIQTGDRWPCALQVLRIITVSPVSCRQQFFILITLLPPKPVAGGKNRDDPFRQASMLESPGIHPVLIVKREKCWVQEKEGCREGGGTPH